MPYVFTNDCSVSAGPDGPMLRPCLGRGVGDFVALAYCFRRSRRRRLVDRHSLPFPWTLSLHRRWRLSPPCVLPLPPWPNSPSVLPFPFPWSAVQTEPRDFPCFTALCRVHTEAGGGGMTPLAVVLSAAGSAYWPLAWNPPRRASSPSSP